MVYGLLKSKKGFSIKEFLIIFATILTVAALVMVGLRGFREPKEDTSGRKSDAVILSMTVNTRNVTFPENEKWKTREQIKKEYKSCTVFETITPVFSSAEITVEAVADDISYSKSTGEWYENIAREAEDE